MQAEMWTHFISSNPRVTATPACLPVV
jgi:hypothetical protein